ncbi:MAG: sensor histidine kinase, partial [Bacteroidia bacterium]|nr:sensor histidine kinase [Bacteroidia bacterium]
SDNKMAGFIIKDEGPGINEEDRKKMFGKFTRLSARPTGGESSNGLGLSIVKKLTDLIGGNITCESEPGAGCCFIVRFPIAAAS